mgnify:CR=1 FL=1
MEFIISTDEGSAIITVDTKGQEKPEKPEKKKKDKK